jgi:hypothetical protein
MGIPIIFIHWGKSDYLKYAIHQAKIQNPTSEVFLISDVKPTKSSDFAYYDLKQYLKETNDFENIYVHLNSVPKWYTILWFKRWFALNNFMKQKKIDGPFLYLDSDVLLYCDITKEYKNFEQFDIIINGDRGPHYTFFKNSFILDQFCKFIFSQYTDKTAFSLLKEKYKYHQLSKIDGGVDDMTILHNFCKSKTYPIGNTPNIYNSKMFEDNIFASEGFEFDNRRKIKKIYWNKKISFGRLLENESSIIFNTLHFQGFAKKYMYLFYSGNDLFCEKILS